MVNPDLIIRSYRKSLSLTISKEGELIVHAPKRLNMNEILKFISEKEKWIVTKQKEIQDKLYINKSIINYEEFLFLGNKYQIQTINGLKKVELAENQILVPNGEKLDILNKLRKWYILNASKILKERIEYFSDIMQIDFATIKISNSKSRWGSCDSLRNIKLNFRLIMLPHKVIDFVIIHELAHILEFNHSKDFYRIIQTIMPNYKIQQRYLKNHDYVLRLFR